MKKAVWIFSAMLLMAAGILLGRFWPRKDAGSRSPIVDVADAGNHRGIVATVKTVPLKKGLLRESLEAYGTVVARASAIANVAVPFEGQVLRVLVSRGQKVIRGTPLIQIEASPHEMLLLAEARRQFRAAAQQRADVKARFKLRLATRRDMLAADQVVALSTLRLTNLKTRGIGGPRTITSTRLGVVARIPAEPGQIVPAGGPLLQLVSAHDIEIRLGVEPEDAVRLKPGYHLTLFPVGESRRAGLDGTIRLVTQEVNPKTRLVNIYVAPPANSGLLLGQFVRAGIVMASRIGLLVPRSAVLPVGSENILFTVHKGRAWRHRIHIELATDEMLEISGSGLVAGEAVVVSGNAELTNGMAVTGKFIP